MSINIRMSCVVSSPHHTFRTDTPMASRSSVKMAFVSGIRVLFPNKIHYYIRPGKNVCRCTLMATE